MIFVYMDIFLDILRYGEYVVTAVLSVWVFADYL